MAVLHVTEDVKPLRIGEFNFIQPGDKVLAVGFPKINLTENLFKDNLYISRGIVNALRAYKEEKIPEKVIWTDAKIDRGNSGGPLFNELGEVVGINTIRIEHTKNNTKTNTQQIIDVQGIAISTKLLEKYLI